jgi:hypothetical protein
MLGVKKSDKVTIDKLQEHTTSYWHTIKTSQLKIIAKYKKKKNQ